MIYMKLKYNKMKQKFKHFNFAFSKTLSGKE